MKISCEWHTAKFCRDGIRTNWIFGRAAERVAYSRRNRRWRSKLSTRTSPFNVRRYYAGCQWDWSPRVRILLSLPQINRMSLPILPLLTTSTPFIARSRRAKNVCKSPPYLPPSIRSRIAVPILRELRKMLRELLVSKNFRSTESIFSSCLTIIHFANSNTGWAWPTKSS